MNCTLYEFAELVKELTEMNGTENDLTAEEYINFDNEISSFDLPINSETVDWKATSIQECFNEYVNREQRIELDSEDDEEPDDIEDEQESVHEVTPREALAMTDRLMHTNGISDESQIALFGVKKNIEKVVINNQKQKDIRDYLYK